jgi:hypothetical protein
LQPSDHEGRFLNKDGIAVSRYPIGVYQKVKRPVSCIVRPGTVVLVIVEVPVEMAPDESNDKLPFGKPKLA